MADPGVDKYNRIVDGALQSRGEETVAKDEGELPDFDDLDLLGDGLTEGEPLDSSSLPDDSVVPQVDEDVTHELKEDEPDDKSKRKKKGKSKRKKKDKIREEISEKGEGEQAGGGLLAAIGNASPYTVMLGLALLAIAIAVFCLFKELGRYDYDIKAETRPVVMAPGIQCGPASTTATA